ncbi:hypothetical protein CIPAW_11G014600 [Carya illinoinensis]|uniref:Uncharacterized protein n=1 Tax=Carya illinoinensis TaxID=32201 RepID=A0A8T1NX61_CARIL|nr:hypothetical protein CIPAW_11G014600 [Carya illinoinensis]
MVENLGETFVDDQETHQIGPQDNKINQEIQQNGYEDNETTQQTQQKGFKDSAQACTTTIIAGEFGKSIEENKNTENIFDSIHSNIYDLVQWKYVDTKLRDLLVEKVKTLGKNNLPFQRQNGKIYQENNGNFLSLIEIIFEFDPIMQKHIRRIQDDSSHQEQMSLILRCVNISTSPIKIDEHFLEFIKVDDTSEKCILGELLDAIKSLELDINNVQGQNNVSILTLKPLSRTCWKSQIESSKAIKFQTPQIRENFEFILGMTICKSLQSKDMHIDIAINYLLETTHLFTVVEPNTEKQSMEVKTV